MKAAFLGIAAFAMLVGGSLPARAHHSHPVFYDQCTSLTKAGERLGYLGLGDLVISVNRSIQITKSPNHQMDKF